MQRVDGIEQQNTMADSTPVRKIKLQWACNYQNWTIEDCVGSESAINCMNPLIHPALCQHFRLVVV